MLPGHKGRPHGLMQKKDDGGWRWTIATYTLGFLVVVFVVLGIVGYGEYRVEIKRAVAEAEVQRHIAVDLRTKLEDVRRSRDMLQSTMENTRRERERTAHLDKERMEHLETRIEQLTTQLAGKANEHGELQTSLHINNQRLNTDLITCKAENQHYVHEQGVLKSLLEEKTSTVETLERRLQLERETNARLLQEQLAKQNTQMPAGVPAQPAVPNPHVAPHAAVPVETPVPVPQQGSVPGHAHAHYPTDGTHHPADGAHVAPPHASPQPNHHPGDGYQVDDLAGHHHV